MRDSHPCFNCPDVTRFCYVTVIRKYAKRTKTCNCWQARENVQLANSEGELQTESQAQENVQLSVEKYTRGAKHGKMRLTNGQVLPVTG